MVTVEKRSFKYMLYIYIYVCVFVYLLRVSVYNRLKKQVSWKVNLCIGEYSWVFKMIDSLFM